MTPAQLTLASLSGSLAGSQADWHTWLCTKISSALWVGRGFIPLMYSLLLLPGRRS